LTPIQAVSVALIAFAAGIALTAALAAGVLRRRLHAVREAERRARTAQRLAELGAMTSGLAHEIKNPLSTIGLNAQLLSESISDLPIDEQEKGRLARRMDALAREVERLRGILTDFLEYAGEIRLEPRPTDLNQAVSELVDFFLPQAERHGVRLRADLAPGPLTVDLDAPHFKQAVLNLMLNATEAMATPTTPTSPAPTRQGSTRPGPAGSGPARPSPAAAGGKDPGPPPPEARAKELILKTARRAAPDRRPELAVHVIDTGPGLSPDAAARIFKPYFTTKRGGTGLGLPTAARIIEEHGGRIDVHSEPGKGTDFTIVLPTGEGE
jgi:signal transduction histidine kinase